ncbi:MAG: IS3 family transposase [Oscillospiraceae bacterium]|nr:IS3 family transposase [Oscillospiraceae bacterium]MBR1479209.1 IS3 family transposase [Lachnospiraceae bacterium]
MITRDNELSISEQCRLIEVNRTSYYYRPVIPAEDAIVEEERIKARIDYWHTKLCYLGVRRLREKLRIADNIYIGKKLLRKYMAEMNIYAIYPKPNLSKADQKSIKMPYLLKNLNIDHPNHVWSIDITYISMGKSHMYLTAIIDWNTRFVVGYELSDTLETAPVLKAVEDAVERYGKPEIINSDQGSQFTSDEYKSKLKELGVRQSMDGKARWVDNVIIERWFRSLKCECLYITEYTSPLELRQLVSTYIETYNYERPHEALGYMYPVDLYLAS